jgi:CubicO group peptidase (beta-lactamase class C family)
MQSVDTLMRKAIEEKIFPGGVLLVSAKGAIIFFEAYGWAQLSSQVPMTQETIFDLASLTKPLATTLAAMSLVQHDQIGLQTPLDNVLTEFQDTDKAKVKLKHLLYHSSGLPDYRPYFRELEAIAQNSRKTALRKLLVQESLIHPIGKKVVYSDLGFMILAWVVERVSGWQLDQFVDARIYQPMGLKNLFFVPANAPSIKRTFAATENCPWRNKVLAGQVHDENAYVVGGIEGHAGLFGTADNIHRLLVDLLLTYHGQPASALFKKNLLRQFFERLPGTDKALGFDTPNLNDASCGHAFSPNSVGHLGFTGTSFWMDLERSVIVILLTNRVHPSRKNEGIKKFRPKLHDAVMKSLLKGEAI